MKVLLLPVNIASDISHKVRALKNIGIDARGFTIAGPPIQSGDNITSFSIGYGNPITIRLRRAMAVAQMWRLIAWADILHWVADPNIFASGLNEKFLRWVNKPGVVQWTGSDIRIPDKDIALNRFYREAFHAGYEYRTESLETSDATQQFFATLGFYPLEFIGMGHYIDAGLFPKRYLTRQTVGLSEYEPKYPSLTKTKPLVVHSPSAPVAKGTKYVLQAIETLLAKYDFDFVLVENLPRNEALKIMGECDIYVDQLILGAHGYAAVEAMAFGKPVICYINPEIGKDYPADLPIINANPETITGKLDLLIGDHALRNESGSKSRQYVEKYHDDKEIALDLVRIYKEVIALRQSK